MDCLFCGAEMADGWVAVSGALPMGAWDAQLLWEPAEVRTMKRRWRDVGKRGAELVLAGRILRRNERAAALCHECGAVVIEPDDAGQ
jgi:diphthamide synthase (EF-2-diphthine--ammonia ligase)